MTQPSKDSFLREVFSECADVLEKHIEQIEADAELDSPESSVDSAAARHGGNVDFLRRIYDKVSAGNYASWGDFFADIQALHAAARRDNRGKKNVLNAVKAVLLTAERLWKNVLLQTESGNSEKALKEREPAQSPKKRKRDEFENVKNDPIQFDNQPVDVGEEMEVENSFSESSSSDFEYGQQPKLKIPAVTDPALVIKLPRSLVERETALSDRLIIRVRNPHYQDPYGKRPYLRLLFDEPVARKVTQQRKPSAYIDDPDPVNQRRQSDPLSRSISNVSRTSTRTPQGPSKRLKTGNDTTSFSSLNKYSSRLKGDGYNDDDGSSSVLDWNNEGAALLLSTSVELQRMLDELLAKGSQAETEHTLGNKMKLELTESHLDVSRDMLGSGKFAQVYRGMMNGRHVAVKCFIQSVATQDDFSSEVVKLSNLVHPNIVEYLGYIPSPTMWIVMELMDRGSLFHVINEERPQKIFTWLQKVDMALEVCSAMEYLHSYGIRHCDLNSKNLLVNFAYQVKVADFGLSQIDDSEDSHIGKHLGTLRWMSPEMIRKECQSMEKADVWSYGVVLIETQEVPYPTYVEADVKYQVSRGHGPTASDQKIWLKCPGWKIVMESCFTTDHKRRPTFQQLRLLLEVLKKALTT